MAKFDVIFRFPASALADVAKRELTVAVKGSKPGLYEYSGAATSSAPVTLDEGDHVTAFLVDSDAAGKRSPPTPAFEYKIGEAPAAAELGSVGIISQIARQPAEAIAAKTADEPLPMAEPVTTEKHPKGHKDHRHTTTHVEDRF